jgi:DNA polymerase III beta subunit-like protein
MSHSKINGAKFLVRLASRAKGPKARTAASKPKSPGTVVALKAPQAAPVVVGPPAPVKADVKAPEAPQAAAKPATDVKAPAAPTPPAKPSEGVIAASGSLLIVHGHASLPCADLSDAQRTYRRLQSGADGNLPEAYVYTNGTRVATIKTNGNAFDTKGALVAIAPTLGEARTAKAPSESEALEPAQAVQVPAHFISAALAVAAKKDEARPFLCSVYLHQVGDQLRIVSGDGHRMLVLSQKCDTKLGWGEEGVMLPREDLDRIAKFIGKGTSSPDFEISFGKGHPHAVVSEVAGIGTFTVNPINGTYAKYQAVLDTLSVFNGGERKPTEGVCMNPAYLKSAGAIAAALESPGIYSFMDESSSKPSAFTFEGVAGAVLIVMPMRVAQAAAALPAATARLIGDAAMRGSIAALKAHATRIKKQIEATKDKAEVAKLEAVAKGYTDRAAELTAALSVKIENKVTKVPETGKEEGASK